MLSDDQAHSSAHTRPLTHRQCIAATEMQMGQSRRAVWVQVRQWVRGAQGVSLALCGRVRELRASDGEWFKVDTFDGPVWAESRNVRLCSGDGRCVCEASAAPDRPPISCPETSSQYLDGAKAPVRTGQPEEQPPVRTAVDPDHQAVPRSWRNTSTGMSQHE